jgi:hypothetical protein
LLLSRKQPPRKENWATPVETDNCTSIKNFQKTTEAFQTAAEQDKTLKPHEHVKVI